MHPVHTKSGGNWGVREIRENDLFRTTKEDGRGVIVGGVIAVGGDDSGRKGGEHLMGEE